MLQTIKKIYKNFYAFLRVAAFIVSTIFILKDIYIVTYYSMTAFKSRNKEIEQAKTNLFMETITWLVLASTFAPLLNKKREEEKD